MSIFSRRSHRFDEELRNYKPVPAVYQLRYSVLRKIRVGEEVLPDIQGREEAKRDVIRAILSGAHPYLVSEEGTGKTRLARSLAKLLPPIVKIKGCPYNDDPKWPPELLCPRCRGTREPAKRFGIEFVSGERRFSRIQGNEYTNEAKLLGLKDIQAIAQGKSPTDPRVFTGTGVFRANRGILFIDELPAIRTNVQVLLHPILEEKKAILEEYNWQHSLDLLLIATGNPKGFSHVYEVPRPLLDRLELIYMGLPEEDVEREIMLKERFSINSDYPKGVEPEEEFLIPSSEVEKEIQRTVAAPWWIIDIINKSTRYSRICIKLERSASIRAGNKAIDHTYANLEMENREVANLKDAYYGLRLALRGRIELSSEYLDLDNPKKSFRRTDRLVEDLMWNAMEDFEPGLFEGCDRGKLTEEIKTILSSGAENIAYKLTEYEQLRTIVDGMKRVAKEKIDSGLMSETERRLAYSPEKLKEKTLQEYNYSALETLVNLALHRRIIAESAVKQIFVPQKITEARSW
jgi:Mg-chelatase subunit ChlI